MDTIFLIKLFIFSASILVLGYTAIYIGKRIENWIRNKFK